MQVNPDKTKHKNNVPFVIIRKYGKNNTVLAKRRRIHWNMCKEIRDYTNHYTGKDASDMDHKTLDNIFQE
jgi:hypothetical protein